MKKQSILYKYQLSWIVPQFVLIVMIVFIFSCSTRSKYTSTAVEVKLPTQTYFDKRVFDSFVVTKTDCATVIDRLNTPELKIQTNKMTKMMYIFEVPAVLFNYVTTTGDNITLKSEGTYDYSQYRKIILIFNENCILSESTYESTLNG